MVIQRSLNPDHSRVLKIESHKQTKWNFNIDNFIDFLGHEIAVNTLTHTAPERYWKGLGYEPLVREVVQMRSKLEEEGINNVKGFRSPFLQTPGDNLYAVLKDYGFEYDSSLATHFGQLWWPFTLDYATEMNECRSENSCPISK